MTKMTAHVTRTAYDENNFPQTLQILCLICLLVATMAEVIWSLVSQSSHKLSCQDSSSSSDTSQGSGGTAFGKLFFLFPSSFGGFIGFLGWINIVLWWDLFQCFFMKGNLAERNICWLWWNCGGRNARRSIVILDLHNVCLYLSVWILSPSLTCYQSPKQGKNKTNMCCPKLELMTWLNLRRLLQQANWMMALALLAE